MSTSIERLRLIAAVVLVAVGGALSTRALAGSEEEFIKACTGYCAGESRVCGIRKQVCCCKENLQRESLRWECVCLFVTDCEKYREDGLCQGV